MQGIERAARWALAALVIAAALAACERDKGDPVDISRQFIVALWTGDTERVDKLSCKDTVWNFTGDPSLTVDVARMTLAVASETDDQVAVTVSGSVTFISAADQVEVRNLDEMGITQFVLQDQNGWKVCDIRSSR